jgi:hypothetical protein
MKVKIIIALLLSILLVSLSACGDESVAATVFEMEMTSSYDDTDPFINEKLFYVSEDVESVEFEAYLQMRSETCLLEIADNETKEVMIELFFREGFNDSGEDKEYITLVDLDKDKEYVIRLTCTEVENVKLVMTSSSSLVKERERPLKPSKD